MNLQKHTNELIKSFFRASPLPSNYKWVVYTTNSRIHGYCVSRKLIVYHGPKPVNYVQAKKMGEIVIDLPLHPGMTSPSIDWACEEARLLAR